MSTYKLYYFPTKGRAEPIRLLFAYKGIKYEDIRFDDEKWTEFKPKTPFGSIPVLEEGGRQLGGSLVILRYLAEKEEFSVAGNNEWENTQLASIADFINDFANETVKFVFEEDEERKKELEGKFKSEVIPKYFGKINEMTKETGYLFHDQLTWPDLFLYNVIELLSLVVPGVTEPFPGLLKTKTNIESETNISKWLKERPPSTH